MITASWLVAPTCSSADINANGVVDNTDWVLGQNSFGISRPTNTPTLTRTPTRTHADGYGHTEQNCHPDADSRQDSTTTDEAGGNLLAGSVTQLTDWASHPGEGTHALADRPHVPAVSPYSQKNTQNPIDIPPSLCYNGVVQ